MDDVSQAEPALVLEAFLPYRLAVAGACGEPRAVGGL